MVLRSSICGVVFQRLLLSTLSEICKFQLQGVLRRHIRHKPAGFH